MKKIFEEDLIDEIQLNLSKNIDHINKFLKDKNSYLVKNIIDIFNITKYQYNNTICEIIVKDKKNNKEKFTLIFSSSVNNDNITITLSEKGKIFDKKISEYTINLPKYCLNKDIYLNKYDKWIYSNIINILKNNKLL